MNNKGHSNEPCGAPQEIVCLHEHIGRTGFYLRVTSKSIPKLYHKLHTTQVLSSTFHNLWYHM